MILSVVENMERHELPALVEEQSGEGCFAIACHSRRPRSLCPWAESSSAFIMLYQHCVF